MKLNGNLLLILTKHKRENSELKMLSTCWFSNRSLGKLEFVSDLLINDKKIKCKTDFNICNHISLGYILCFYVLGCF